MKTIFTLALILLSSFAQAADFTITVQPAGGGAGVNTSLSNLVTTSINQDLLPQNDRVQNIGSNAVNWNNAYFGNTVNATGFSSRNGASFASLGIYTTLPSGTLAPHILFETNASPLALATQSVGYANTGSLLFETGNATGSTFNSGDISFLTGTSATGTRGKISLDGSEIDATSKKITNLATPTLATDAATKEYVDSASGGGSGPSVSSEIVQATCDASNVCTITLSYTPKMVFYIALKMASNSKLFNFTVSNTVTEISQAQALGINGPSFVVNEQQKTLTFLPKDAIGTNAVISNGLLQNYTQVRYLH